MSDPLQIIARLAALAQEHRLAAYRLLVEAGEGGLAAGDIAAKLDIAASSLSFHLSHLERSGLVTRRRMGRSLVYSADYAEMTALIAYLTENCCGGDAVGGCLPVVERNVA